MSEPRSTRAEDDARHLEAHREHKGAPAPAYRPIRARLLLKVEGREAVEVASFEPLEGALASGQCYYMPSLLRTSDSDALSLRICSALTVEVRELLAEQRAHEEGDPAHCYVGNKSHDAHELLAPGQKCGHCSFIAPEGTDHA